MWRPLRWSSLAAVAGALVIAACSSERSSPTEPPVNPPVSENIVPSGCPSLAATAQSIVSLFPAGSGGRLTATVYYAAILFFVNTNRQADARTVMFQLLDYTFKQFKAGKLTGKFSLTTRQNLLAFEKGLYCTVGLPTDGLTLPGDPSDPGHGEHRRVHQQHPAERRDRRREFRHPGAGQQSDGERVDHDHRRAAHHAARPVWSFLRHQGDAGQCRDQWHHGRPLPRRLCRSRHL